MDDPLYTTYRAARPKSTALYQRASKTLGGKAGHDLRHFEPVPFYASHGRKGRKWDVDGNEYIDFLMGNGALLLGHANPAIVEAITRTVGQGTHFGNDHPLHIEWAELVQQLVPCAERVRFVNSGTEATLLAIRLARAFTGHTKILRFDGHFHGWHDDVVHGFQPPFEAAGSLGIPPSVRQNQISIPVGNLDLLEETLRNNDLAAAIIEPSGGSWGRIPLDPEFLHGLRECTARHQVQLIFDEVITGFRFSPGGAQGLYGVRPDLATFAKILCGGMPGGAVAGRADIMELFDLTGDAQHDRFGRVNHQGTFNAAPLCAAAGIAALKQIATDEPIEQANTLATKLRADWDAVLQRHQIAGYTYGLCSIFHVYFETDPQYLGTASSRDDLKNTDSNRLKGMPGKLIHAYQFHLRHHGVDLMSSTGGVLSSTHTEADVDQATDAFEKTLIALRDEHLIATL